MTFSSRRPRTGRITLSIVALAAASSLLLSGCFVFNDSSNSSTGDPTSGSAVTGGLDVTTASTLEWADCDKGYKCASVTVPMDWDKPDGDKIQLALKMLPAKDEAARKGSLFINPGGPGGSGVDLVEQASYIFTDDIMDAYDIIGFDPRGVGQSSAVVCYDDAQRDAQRQESFDMSTPDGLAAAEASYAKFAQACDTNTGALLGHIDTVSAAKDLEAMRQMVGDSKLSYLGFSYGTLLGATYAGLYPDKVGKLVLDGALDPSLSYEDVGAGQAAAFESSLGAYIKDCQAGKDCPLTGSADDGVNQIRTLLSDLSQTPMRTNDKARPLTDSLAANAIIYAMYSEQLWPTLSQTLGMAMHDRDGSGLLALADYQADRDKNGHYTSNQDEAFIAIDCLDYTIDSDPAAMKADADRLEQLSPTFGKYIAYGGITCKSWPHAPVREPAKITADGAAPILVIGTTGDPATPYEWAEALADQLDSGTLLTYVGEGHTAYSRDNTCVAKYVSAYFLKDEVPADGAKC